MLKYSVGFDVSSKDFKACISVIDKSQRVKVKGSRTFQNTKSGFKDADQWISKHWKNKEISLVICMEATGIYYENMALYFFDKQYSVSVILPNKSKKYIEAIGLKTKNDKIDAQGLSRMGAEQCLDLWQPMGSYYYQLRELTRQHQSLQELKTSVNNQLHASKKGMYINKLIIKQQNKAIQLIIKQIKEVKNAINEHIQNDKEVEQKVNNICKIKGVAILTAAVVIAETNGFELFKNSRQLVSYTGYDVVENQSGKRIGKTRISKKGNSRILTLTV